MCIKWLPIWEKNEYLLNTKRDNQIKQIINQNGKTKTLQVNIARSVLAEIP